VSSTEVAQHSGVSRATVSYVLNGTPNADGLDDRVRAEPAGEVLDPGDAIVAAFGDDVGRANSCASF
jgi:hypothetical protein